MQVRHIVLFMQESVGERGNSWKMLIQTDQKEYPSVLGSSTLHRPQDTKVVVFLFLSKPDIGCIQSNIFSVKKMHKFVLKLYFQSFTGIHG